MPRFIFLSLAIFFLAAIPWPGFCFDWPAAVAPAQKIQALKIEIANIKSLIASSKSKTSISARSYIAVDLSSGKVLLQKKPDEVHSLASVTKLMTAVIALENIDLDKTVTLTPKMLASEGGSAALFAGLNVSVENLLRASLTQSANDAAESLAQTIGKEKFIKTMNARAKQLGMKNTVFADVCGLNQASRSSAADMAKLLAHIKKNRPEILAMTRDNNFWLPDARGNLLKFQNMNNFHYLSNFIGGKTGYLPQAKDSFAAVFDVNGKPVAIAMLHSSNYQADTFKIIRQIKK